MATRRPPVARLARLALVAALVAGTATACGSSGPVGRASVATVDGVEITREDVVELADAQLAFADAAVKGAERLVDGDPTEENQTRLESAKTSREQTRAAFEGTGDDTLSTAGLATVLTQLVQNEVAAAALRDAGGEVTEAERETARTDLMSQLEPLGITTTAGFDALLDAEVERRTLEAALQAAVSTPEDERVAQLEDAYEQGYGDQICLGVIGVADEPTAVTALQRLAAGETVEAVAADVSLQEGGDPNACVAGGQIIGVFGPEALDVEAGGLVGPGQSQGVFLVGKITSVERPTFEEARADLEAAVPEDTEAAASSALQEATESIDVTVDPRFGTWDVASGSVLAPEDPGAPATTVALPGTDPTAEG